MHSVMSVYLEHCKTYGKRILNIKYVIHFSLCSDNYLTGYALDTMCWKACRSLYKLPVTFCLISVGNEMCPQIVVKVPNIWNFMKFWSVFELFHVHREKATAIIIGDRNVSERAYKRMLNFCVLIKCFDDTANKNKRFFFEGGTYFILNFSKSNGILTLLPNCLCQYVTSYRIDLSRTEEFALRHSYANTMKCYDVRTYSS
jgi:hypothetical protein